MSVLAPILTPKRGPRSEVTESLLEILDSYLRWHRIEGSTTDTLKHKKKELGLFIRYLAAQSHSLDPKLLTSFDVLGHLEDMKLRGLSPYSVSTRLRSIRAWCHWMIDWQVIEADPCQRIKAPKLPKVRKPFLTAHEFQSLLDLCPLNTLLGSRRQAMLWLMIMTGIRRRELGLLQLADLDWDNQTIRVIYGKGQKERQIPFYQDCQRVTLRYLHERKDSQPCLWVTEEGKPLQYHGIGQDLKRLTQRAGIELKDVCHIFRRTFSANAVRQSIPRPYVQAIAGWSTPQMLDRYVAAMEAESGAVKAFREFRPF